MVAVVGAWVAVRALEKTGPEYGPLGTPEETVLAIRSLRSHPLDESQSSRPRRPMVAARWSSLRKLMWTMTFVFVSRIHITSVAGVWRAREEVWGGEGREEGDGGGCSPQSTLRSSLLVITYNMPGLLKPPRERKT